MTFKELRKAKGMTMQVLADGAGIGIDVIKKLDYGKVSPRDIPAWKLLAIAEVLGYDPYTLTRD